MDGPPGFFEGTEMPDAGWWEALFPDPARVIETAGIEPGQEVIDLCAGDGWFTLQIAKIARRVVALDIDGRLLRTARQRLIEHGLANHDAVEGRAQDLPSLIARPADVVFMANAFHGVPDRPGLARAVRTALKPGGLFSILNWHPRPREETVVLGEPRGPRTELRVSPRQTIAAIEPAGFNIVRVVDVAPYHYTAIFRRTP